MKKKLLFAIVLVVVALSVALVGCGGDDTPAGGGDTIKYSNPSEFWTALEESTNKASYYYHENHNGYTLNSRLEYIAAMEGNVIEHSSVDDYQNGEYDYYNRVFIEYADGKYNVYEFGGSEWIARAYNSINEMMTEAENDGFGFHFWSLPKYAEIDDIKSLNDLFNYGYYFLGYNGYHFHSNEDFPAEEIENAWSHNKFECGWFHTDRSWKIISNNEMVRTSYLSTDSDHSEICQEWKDVIDFEQILIGCDRKIEIPAEARAALK